MRARVAADLLVKKLGSEQAAVDLLARDPTLMLFPKYDGLNPKLEKMLSAEDISASSARSGGGGGSGAIVLVALTTMAAAVAANELVLKGG